jgi:hypothetical protein
MPAAIHAFISTIFGIFCQRIDSGRVEQLRLAAVPNAQNSFRPVLARTNRDNSGRCDISKPIAWKKPLRGRPVTLGRFNRRAPPISLSQNPCSLRDRAAEVSSRPAPAIGRSSLTSFPLSVSHWAIASPLPEMVGVGLLMHIKATADAISFILTSC